MYTSVHLVQNHVMAIQGRCHYCGIKGPLTRDHVIPRSKGGSRVSNNIVMACHGCNLRKGAQSVEDFTAYLKSHEGRLWLHQRGVHKTKSDLLCEICQRRARDSARRREERAMWRKHTVPFNSDVISAQGKRPQMEDTHNLMKIGDTLLGAIFDGHGGKDVADLAALRFPALWQEAVGDNCDRMHEALTRLHEESRGLTGGACAVAFSLQGTVLTVGNVGDAELAWVIEDQAVTVTEAHRLDNEGEKNRLLQAGAVIQLPYFFDPRTGRGLMPTRSIGDHEFESIGLSAKPYVRDLVLPRAGWIVMACDGLWDVMKPWELPDLLRHISTPTEASKFLLDQALRARGSTDNVSIIVVRYQPAEENFATTTISDSLIDEKVA